MWIQKRCPCIHDLNIAYLKKTHNFLQRINLRLFTCFGEITEKYITLSVPIEKKVTRIVKNGEEITKTISYILKFIDSARFMESSLSNFNNNLAKTIHKIKYKYGHNKKNWKTCGINCCLEFTNVKDTLIE